MTGLETLAALQLSLHSRAFEPLALLARWEQALVQARGALPAATAQFTGRVRAWDSRGEPLLALELEHYPGMTEARIQAHARTVIERHGVHAVRVAHRVGRVLPGEAIVLVAAAADRRGPAQRACAELLEALKHHAPFWKKELRPDGTGAWVQGNTPL